MATFGKDLSMGLPLDALRILLPPSRPEPNPLLKILRSKGAEVIEWPAIRAAEPQDYTPMDEAIRKISRFDWKLFSGGNCVENFLARMESIGLNPVLALSNNVVAVGHSALSRLKKAGVPVTVYPKRHLAEDVASAVQARGPLDGKCCLLVRVAEASESLPRALQARGAAVEQVEGYSLRLETDAAAAAWNPQPHLIALVNPAAVRVFVEALNICDRSPQDIPPGTEVACVGPGTAEEAHRVGLRVDSVSAGSQSGLLTDILSRFEKR